MSNFQYDHYNGMIKQEVEFWFTQPDGGNPNSVQEENQTPTPIDVDDEH